jgi:hypothetical protein
MARTGIPPKVKIKVNSQKQQAKNAELETIIEDFGAAMRNADKFYMADSVRECGHNSLYRFTFNMEIAWKNYINWCKRNG